jgi:NADPH2 dehydrogenase
MPGLFDPFTLKGLRIKNRVVMSPMCQYSVTAEDGIPTDWHYVHLVSRAVGGTGLIITEMTDVHPDGRITVNDLGIWDDRQIPAFQRIVDACHTYGAMVGIQIAHAGRKAQSSSLDIVGPSAIPFSEDYRTPRALTKEEIRRLVDDFRKGAERAVKAGFDVIELHGAHGYLLHQFMSPRTNKRNDEYGEPTRFVLEVIQAVRSVMPSGMPLFMRISATEYNEGGYTVDDMVHWCREFKQAGVDLFDVSSGGEGPAGPPSAHPGYQVPFAARIRQVLDVPVMAVGRLENPHLAESVVRNGQADLVAVARGMLRDPYWANTASVALGYGPLLPKQYHRAYSF